MKKIGEHLSESGLVSPEALERALLIQDNSGSMIGQILQAEGMISSYRFYKELAKFKNLPFVNLEEYKVNLSVMIAEEKDDYKNMQFVPFDAVNKVVYIATTDPNDELLKYLDEKFNSYKIFITSPFDLLWCLQKRFNNEYSDEASEKLFDHMPDSSSKYIFKSIYMKGLIVTALGAALYALTYKSFLIPFLYIMNIFFLLSMISKIFFFLTGVRYKKELNKELRFKMDDKELPVYSILIPLYNEKENTIARLLGSLRDLDYPKDKLDIKLIVEVNDSATIDIIKKLKPSHNHQIIKVPEKYPKTKPKACNYALHFCKGEFVTIYDAEDHPEPMQLRKVLTKFYSEDENISCVQARLNYYNRNENALTQLFSLEYSSWFDFILYGLQKLNVPIPLGGTSNHFRIKMLRSLYAWDPYNVTEDADLGVRLSLAGLKTAIVDSVTLEEAPINIKGWLKQRSRWIKGYFQTFIVHTRSPVRLYKTLGFGKSLGLFFFVGAPGLVYFTVPIVVTASLISMALNVELPGALLWISYFNLKLAIVVNLLIAVYVASANKWMDVMAGIVLFPFYWLLHCIASYEAVYELMIKPHYWNKTEHGVSKFVDGEE